MTQFRLSKIDWTLELVCGLFILGTLILILTNYNTLPDILPRHFGFLGKPDGFGSKDGIWFLPTAKIIGYIGLTILGRHPKSFNYPYEITVDNAEIQYRNSALMIRSVKTIIVVIFSYLTFAKINIGLGNQDELGILFTPISLTSLLGTVIYFTYKGFKLR